MKPIFIRMTMLMSVAFALGPTLGLAAGKTAKGILPQATAVAKKWNADAVLTAASTLDAKPDGTAQAWTVGTAFGPGEVAVVLDAKTGALLTKHEGQ